MNKNTLYGLIGMVVVLSAVNLFFVTTQTQHISAAITAAKEDARPANLEVIKLVDTECKDCFDIDSVLTGLKGKNVNLVKEEVVLPPSDKAQGLVNMLGIKKLPTLIVSGEIKKPSLENIWKGKWELKDVEGKGYALYTDILPPFLDTTKNNRVVGRVSATHIVDSSCRQCSDLSQVVDFLKQGGVVFSEEERLDYTSTEAKSLITKFAIQRVPAVIISNEVLEYPSIKEIWGRLGATEKEGFFALHSQAPPYRDVKSDSIKGLVHVIYLGDKLCKSCYDINVNKRILANLGILPVSESLLDVSSAEGSGLLEKYKIEKVPIILISPEGGAYFSLNQIWPQVGDIASDSWFVMRKPELLGNYKDLKTGSEIVVQQDASGGA